MNFVNLNTNVFKILRFLYQNCDSLYTFPIHQPPCLSDIFRLFVSKCHVLPSVTCHFHPDPEFVQKKFFMSFDDDDDEEHDLFILSLQTAATRCHDPEMCFVMPAVRWWNNTLPCPVLRVEGKCLTLIRGASVTTTRPKKWKCLDFPNRCQLKCDNREGNLWHLDLVGECYKVKFIWD